MTVEAILMASAQILEKQKPFDTNRIARRAGVSVGTLYQYFPDKQAILKALAAREMNLLRDKVTSRRHAGADSATRAFIHALIWAFEGKPGLRKAVVSAHLAGESPIVLAAETDRTSGLFPYRKSLGFSRIDAFVVTRAILGAVRAAVLEESPFLYKPAFEEALVRLVKGYRR